MRSDKQASPLQLWRSCPLAVASHARQGTPWTHIRPTSCCLTMLLTRAAQACSSLLRAGTPALAATGRQARSLQTTYPAHKASQRMLAD